MTYINEQTESVESPVFQMSSLTKMYQERVQQPGSSKKANSTGLKKKLDQITNLKEAPQGKDILLNHEKDIGGALKLACMFTDDANAMILQQTRNNYAMEFYKC